MKIGSRVAYSASFLKRIGATTGELPSLRGEVISIKISGLPFTLVKVRWDDGRESSCNKENLAEVGPNSSFCQCD